MALDVAEGLSDGGAENRQGRWLGGEDGTGIDCGGQGALKVGSELIRQQVEGSGVGNQGGGCRGHGHERDRLRALR